MGRMASIRPGHGNYIRLATYGKVPATATITVVGERDILLDIDEAEYLHEQLGEIIKDMRKAEDDELNKRIEAQNTPQP